MWTAQHRYNNMSQNPCLFYRHNACQSKQNFIELQERSMSYWHILKWKANQILLGRVFTNLHRQLTWRTKKASPHLICHCIHNTKPTKGQTCILFVISNKLHTDLRINKDSVQSNSNAKRPGYSHQMDWNPITVKDI